MYTSLLLGPSLPINLNKIQRSYNNKIEIHGNQKDFLTCNDINLNAHSRVIISAHGEYSQNNNLIDLCSEDNISGKAFNYIAKSKPINFELFSCFSGTALPPSTTLSEGSTLITFTSNKVVLLSINEEYIMALGSTSANNPFLNFARYIFIVADVIKFGIQSNVQGMLIFSTKIQSLEDFSNSEIRKFQESQLDLFLNFSRTSQQYLDSYNAAQVKEMLEFFQDNNNKNMLLEQYNINRYKDLLLINLVYINDINKTMKLIEMGADLNTKINGGFTPLHIAAQKGHADMVKELARAGSYLNKKSNGGFTSLHLAAQNGHVEVVKELATAGTNLNAKTNNGFTPLDIATQEGHVDIVKILLAAGSDVKYTDSILYNIWLYFFCNFQEIKDNLALFKIDPVKYILSNNEDASSAAAALENLMIQSHLKNSIYSMLKIQNCLYKQADNSVGDWNLICGENGVYNEEL